MPKMRLLLYIMMIYISNKTLRSLRYTTKQLILFLHNLAEVSLLDIIIQVKLNGVAIKTLDESISHFVYKKIFDTKRPYINPFGTRTQNLSFTEIKNGAIIKGGAE